MLQEQDPLVEIFIYECQQLLETLEETLLAGEKEHYLNDEQINEIFRIMHTIKGSAAMMSFDDMAHLAHTVEDMFSQIREKKARSGDWDNLFEIVLEAADMLKSDVAAIALGQAPDSQSKNLIDRIHTYLELVSHRKAKPEAEAQKDDISDDDEADLRYAGVFYIIRITFETGCQMENIRAFGVVNALAPLCAKKVHIPEDLMNDEAGEYIAENGFIVYINSAEHPDNIKKILDETMFLSSASIVQLPDDSDDVPDSLRLNQTSRDYPEASSKSGAEATAKQNFISVNINKLDKLMDLVGEIVTTESMVTKNPEILAMNISGFDNTAKQLEKLTTELQEIVMSTRMIPVSTTFQKMTRLVRDMSKKIGKQVNFQVIGEETEVDKNIIDNLSDPLMHLIRNAVDHGLEPPDERLEKGKHAEGNLLLEARSVGGDVMIIVSDDGRGLARDIIVKKAIEKGFTSKSESEISDKEAFSLIFMPGLTTNAEVTEFSGRGVGMDVVRRNIEKVGGTISLDSAPDMGSKFTIRIPLTLAIMRGMKLKVGDLIFIVPMLSIQESFKPKPKDVLRDPDGREMIMIRGECYPVVRLHELFGIESKYKKLEDGILVVLNAEDLTFCLFIDELIGEQQAVMKPLPPYLQAHSSTRGIGGCTILGDGSIVLIIDVNKLVTAD